MSNTSKPRLGIGINAGSMADIAFLLLIFFLVTTTISSDNGIMVQLPPYVEDAPVVDIPAKNVLTVLVNSMNQLFVEGEVMQIENLGEKTKSFISNPMHLENLPSNPRKAIISLQNDRGTSYETYIAVYNELKAAYRELWDEAALDHYGKLYQELPATYQKRIRADIPLVISEAEPTDYEGGQ